MVLAEVICLYDNVCLTHCICEINDHQSMAACSCEGQFLEHVDHDIDGDGDDVLMYYMNVHLVVDMCPDGSHSDHNDNED